MMPALRKSKFALLALASFAVCFGLYLYLYMNAAHADTGSGSGSAVATLDAAHADAMTAFDAAPATGEAPGAPVADPPIPDPIDDAGGFVGEVTSSWQRGAYLSVAIALIFGLIVVLKRYVAWLRVGWRAVAVTVATTALTTMFVALGQGAQPTFAWAANILGAAVLMVINGKGEAKPTP